MKSITLLLLAAIPFCASAQFLFEAQYFVQEKGSVVQLNPHTLGKIRGQGTALSAKKALDTGLYVGFSAGFHDYNGFTLYDSIGTVYPWPEVNPTYGVERYFNLTGSVMRYASFGVELEKRVCYLGNLTMSMRGGFRGYQLIPSLSDRDLRYDVPNHMLDFYLSPHANYALISTMEITLGMLVEVSATSQGTNQYRDYLNGLGATVGMRYVL